MGPIDLCSFVITKIYIKEGVRQRPKRLVAAQYILYW